MFQNYARDLIAGQAHEVIKSFGVSLCNYETPSYSKAAASTLKGASSPLLGPR